MFKRILYMMFAIQAIALNASSQGLLKRLGEKAANAGSDLLIKKSTQKAEKAIDGNPSSKGKKETNGEEKGTEPAKGSKLATAYSKYDFVPGEKILLYDNFEQDVIGQFPLKWFTNGSGEIVTLDGQSGKWLQLNSGLMLSPVVKLPENFTMEFDLFLNLSQNSTRVLPGFSFQVFDRGEKNKRLQDYQYSLKNIMYIQTSFNSDKAVVQLDSRENAKQKMKSDKVFLEGFQSNYGSVVHVALSIQKERLRLWYNANKVLDMPTAVAEAANFNQFLFGGPKTAEGQPGFYISNLKVAAGIPDMRAKLLDQGRFVTNGILFDSNSDKIKPESFGLIKEIASAIKESPGIKLKIIGHTDSDGGADANLLLSKKRADAVKNTLVGAFGIEGGKIVTDGKGAAEPIGSNTTASGKAENRRVEFVKL